MGDFSLKKLNSQAHKRNSEFSRSYKGKSAFSRRSGTSVESKINKSSSSALPSNWDKYEQDIDSNCQSSTYVLGIDIDMLSILPTNNNQFMLKQDKVFLPRNDSTLDPGVIFDLDMELINLSLATIPFYKRIDMDPSLITSNGEIQFMNKIAVDATSVYHEYLNRTETETEVSISNDEDDEVEIRTDELCIVDSENRPQRDSETKDLEDWLEKIL